jgi:hypothetical protein
MTPSMMALQPGRTLLSAVEQRRYAQAGAYLRRRCGTRQFALAGPLSAEELLVLELTCNALAGDIERVDRNIDEIGDVSRATLRPQ